MLNHLYTQLSRLLTWLSPLFTCLSHLYTQLSRLITWLKPFVYPLQVVRADCDGTVLSFTAPGASLDSEDPAATYILKMADTATNLTGTSFDTGVNVVILEADLISGSLVPVPGGQAVDVGLSADRCPPNQLVFFAVRAVNADGLSSPVSNIVLALPACQSSSLAVRCGEVSLTVLVALVLLWSML